MNDKSVSMINMNGKFKLTDDDKSLIKKLSEHKCSKESEKRIMDSFDTLFDDIMKTDKYPIMLLYLYMATARGLTLREVYERYKISRDYDISTDDPRHLLYADFTIKIEPREYFLDISINEFAEYQMKVAQFLQDIIVHLEKKINRKRHGK